MNVKFNYVNGTPENGFPITVDDKIYYFYPNYYLTDKKTVKYTGNVSYPNYNFIGNYNWIIDGTSIQTTPSDDVSFFDPMGVWSTIGIKNTSFSPTCKIGDTTYYRTNGFFHTRGNCPRSLNGVLKIINWEADQIKNSPYTIDSSGAMPKFETLMPEEYKKDQFALGLTSDVKDFEEYFGKTALNGLFDDLSDDYCRSVCVFPVSSRDSLIDKDVKIIPAYGQSIEVVSSYIIGQGVRYTGKDELNYIDVLDGELNIVKIPSSSNNYWYLNESTGVFNPVFGSDQAAIDFITLKEFEFRSNNKNFIDASYFPANIKKTFLTTSLGQIWAPFKDPYYSKMGNMNVNIPYVTFDENDNVELRFKGDRICDYTGASLGTIGRWVGSYNEEGITLTYQKILETDIDSEYVYDVVGSITSWPSYSDSLLNYIVADKNCGLGINEFRGDYVAYDPQSLTICI